jgi:hypothetical protein
MKTVTYHEQVAIVNDNGLIYVTITADNGQELGGTIRDENNNILASGLQEKFNLGTGASLRGKTYRVITNGLDVLPNTDVIEATQTLSGDGLAANNDLELPKNGELPDPADGLIIYNVRYTFN